jgi:hypothetical protein
MGGNSSCFGSKRPQPYSTPAKTQFSEGVNIQIPSSYKNEKSGNRMGNAIQENSVQSENSYNTINLPSTLQSKTIDRFSENRLSASPHQFGFFKLYPV